MCSAEKSGVCRPLARASARARNVTAPAACWKPETEQYFGRARTHPGSVDGLEGASLKLKILIGAFAVALPFSAPVSAAFAAANLTNIEICNSFSQTAHFAIAYAQSTGEWVSRGWLSIVPGKCYYFDTAITVPDFYFRAQTDPYRQNGKLSKNTWGYSGDKSFCVEPNDKETFNYWAAETAVGCAKNDFVPFANGTASYVSDSDASYTLTLNADGKTVGMNFLPVK
jgi:uncharacterized membrane protein